MLDWIKLKQLRDGDVRALYVHSYGIDKIASTGDESCRIYQYASDGVDYCDIVEAAEDVIAKIKEVEEAPVSPAKRFTEEQYRALNDLIESYMKDHVMTIQQEEVRDIIKEILKEYK